MTKPSWSRNNLAGPLSVVVLCGLALTGCGPGYGDLTFPRGSQPTYQLDALFDDALNLADGAPVKVDGLSVGEVQSVRLDGVRARVTLDIDEDTTLYEGTHARLRYDTPLGEVYVEMTPADELDEGALLGDGDVLEGPRTSTAPTVEDTLAQASLLVNGGGLSQVGTITTELNLALDGREPAVRQTLERTTELLRGINSSQGDLTSTLQDLDAAAAELKDRRATLRRAVTRIGPAADVLRDNQDELTRLLADSDDLATKADDLLTRTQRDLLQVLDKLGPVIESVLASKDDLIRTFGSVESAADLLAKAVPGDFLGLEATLRIDLKRLLGGLTGNGTPPPVPGNPGLPGLPGLPDLPGLHGLPGLPDLSSLPNLTDLGLLGNRAKTTEPTR